MEIAGKHGSSSWAELSSLSLRGSRKACTWRKEFEAEWFFFMYACPQIRQDSWPWQISCPGARTDESFSPMLETCQVRVKEFIP